MLQPAHVKAETFAPRVEREKTGSRETRFLTYTDHDPFSPTVLHQIGLEEREEMDQQKKTYFRP